MSSKIGIITWHHYGNFGSALQAYALQTTLSRIGYLPRIINYRGANYHKIDYVKDRVKSALNCISHHISGVKYYPFIEFQNKYFHQSAVVWDNGRFKKVCRDMECVICGSDQIWAPNVFNPIYFANFIADKEVKKISYAASIGLKYIPEKLIPEYRELLKEFHAVGIREEVGKNLLSEKCGIEATVVIDPTLLLNVSEYSELEREPRQKIPEKYIFCYFLNENNLYEKTVKRIAGNSNYEIIGISRTEDNYRWITRVEEIGPSEFLWLIHNAQIVITDSFHGTIFSLLYHKEFYVFERFLEDDPINQNERIFQLDSMFDIRNRILRPDTVELTNDMIDFDKFEERLKREREASVGFLKEALKKDATI